MDIRFVLYVINWIEFWFLKIEWGEKVFMCWSFAWRGSCSQGRNQSTILRGEIQHFFDLFQFLSFFLLILLRPKIWWKLPFKIFFSFELRKLPPSPFTFATTCNFLKRWLISNVNWKIWCLHGRNQREGSLFLEISS